MWIDVVPEQGFAVKTPSRDGILHPSVARQEQARGCSESTACESSGTQQPAEQQLGPQHLVDQAANANSNTCLNCTYCAVQA